MPGVVFSLLISHYQLQFYLKIVYFKKSTAGRIIPQALRGNRIPGQLGIDWPWTKTQIPVALRYNPDGRGSVSWWDLWDFFTDLIFPVSLWPRGRLSLGVDSSASGSTKPLTEMSTRDLTWSKGGRCLGLTTLPPSCSNCLKILKVSTSWNPRGLSRPVRG
jgi:hypothetical protein